MVQDPRAGEAVGMMTGKDRGQGIPDISVTTDGTPPNTCRPLKHMAACMTALYDSCV